LTDDEIVALGTYCADTLNDPNFNLLVQQYELQIVSHILGTEAHETKKREGIYASALGFREFLGHMKAILSEAQKLSEPQAASEYDPQTQDNDE
jgi:hypothetical protein